jgi:hypothetical protein
MEVRIQDIKLDTMAARQRPFQIVKLTWLTKRYFLNGLALSRGPIPVFNPFDLLSGFAIKARRPEQSVKSIRSILSIARFRPRNQRPDRALGRA